MALGEREHPVEASGDCAEDWGSGANVYGKVGSISEETIGRNEGSNALEAARVQGSFSKDLVGAEAREVSQLIADVLPLKLFNIVQVGIIYPEKVLALNREGEELVLVNRAALNLVQGVQLALEQIELTSFSRLLI